MLLAFYAVDRCYDWRCMTLSVCYAPSSGDEAGPDGADPVCGDPVPEEETVHRHRWLSEGG